MLMRMVEARINSDALNDFQEVYSGEIIPVLEETPGCIFAGLLQSVSDSDRLVSLTLWQSKEKAQDYVESGLFQRNLDLAEPFMEESSEWKIQLSKDDTLNYKQVEQEPTVKSFKLATDPKPISEEMKVSRKFLRILSLDLIQGKEEEFKEIYHNEIQPELKSVPGCRYSFLIDNSQDDQEMLSFTIWDDLESVKLYEKEGKFRHLLNKVQHTLAELYQWKMALEQKKKPSMSVSNRDIDVSKFTLVTGEKFK
jgi:heme-degrading monooxygenase HmoA